MFYLGTILLCVGLTNFASLVRSFVSYALDPYFNSFVLTNFWTGLILTALGLICIIKRWNRPHKHSLAGRIYAIFLLFVAFGNLLGTVSINEYTVLTIVARIISVSSFLIPGVLSFIYNRKLPEVTQIVESEPVTPTETDIYTVGSDIDRLVYKLKMVLNTSYAQDHPEFKEDLTHSIAILNQMQRDDFKVDQAFLEQIAKLSDFYLDIEDNEIQTTQSRQILQKIADTFDTINEALENIYDRNFSQQALDIEGDIIAMKAELNMNGNLDSPFDKFKKETQIQ